MAGIRKPKQVLRTQYVRLALWVHVAEKIRRDAEKAELSINEYVELLAKKGIDN